MSNLHETVITGILSDIFHSDFQSILYNHNVILLFSDASRAKKGLFRFKFEFPSSLSAG